MAETDVKECWVTAPGAALQNRYRRGHSFIRRQQYRNDGTTNRPRWTYLTTYQLPKQATNAEIKDLRKDRWKITKLVRA